MSSVIKMDIPESCAACKLSFLLEQPEGHYERICPLLQHEVSDYNEGRPKDCWFIKEVSRLDDFIPGNIHFKLHDFCDGCAEFSVSQRTGKLCGMGYEYAEHYLSCENYEKCRTISKGMKRRDENEHGADRA